MDTTTWITKKETASILGVSEKTVERIVDEHRLAPVERRRSQDNRRELCFDPDEVEKLRYEREKPLNAVIVRPNAQVKANGSASAAAQAIAPIAWIEQFSRPRVTDKLMLTQKEAGSLTGIPCSLIARWRKEGSLFALRTGAGWRYRKTDLVHAIESLQQNS